MPKPSLTPRGEIIISNNETITIERPEVHFQWIKQDGALKFQQLYSVRPLAADVWRGEWRTLWQQPRK